MDYKFLITLILSIISIGFGVVTHFSSKRRERKHLSYLAKIQNNLNIKDENDKKILELLYKEIDGNLLVDKLSENTTVKELNKLYKDRMIILNFLALDIMKKKDRIFIIPPIIAGLSVLFLTFFGLSIGLNEIITIGITFIIVFIECLYMGKKFWGKIYDLQKKKFKLFQEIVKLDNFVRGDEKISGNIEYQYTLYRFRDNQPY